jgi:adenylosuccinate synthase
LDEEGEKMRKEGNEFGSTTGRPRRCGWIDLPSLKYSIMINGVTQLLMMKADVLNIFPTIKICTHYKLSDGTITETMPYEFITQKIIPVYTEMKGWNTSLRGITKDSMPKELNDYIDYLEKALSVPITVVSIGPDREQTILKDA